MNYAAASKALRGLFVFEMANNHQGDVEHGLRIIEAVSRIADKRGVKAAVKLQYRDLDTLIHSEHVLQTDNKHIRRFLETRLEPSEFLRLLQATKDAGMLAVVTPFDEPSVHLALRHDVDFLKVASCSANDWPLLEVVADAGKPVIVSTGGLSLPDIDAVVHFLRHRGVEFALMHCVGLYPTPDDVLQLGFIQRLRRRYPDLLIGYSGHESPGDTEVVQMAVAQGAELFERHVGVPTNEVALNAYSMNPEQADAWVEKALRAQQVCRGGKTVTEAERQSMRSLQRGVYAKRAIKQGEHIGPADVYFAMPCQEGQLTSGDFGRHRSRYVAGRDYAEGEAITELPADEDAVNIARRVVHQTRGMLNEAGIAVSPDARLELSHHYGVEAIERAGAQFVTVINRDYAKKLMVLLPGQMHPMHRHWQKEETFQVLWGDCVVRLEEDVHNLRAGDTLLVPRGMRHSMRSETGAILEEVSTRHLSGDSEYVDEAIQVKDPMERKTILEQW